MSEGEIERMLRSMLLDAQLREGQIGQKHDVAELVAKLFTAWLRSRAEEFLEEGESAAHRLQRHLEGVLNWEEHGEALHEMIHVRDAFGDLRHALELNESSEEA